MTLAQVHYPSSPIQPGELDGYLAQGWFRMGQTIFTTHILYYDRIFYSAVWLRIPLRELEESKTFRKLKKLNAPFHVVFRPALADQEKEELFAKYKRTLPFEASASLEHLLFGKNISPDIYNTWEVALYDNNRLIAAGFFDLGQGSAAGISSFYDPEYKKHSLGKYLIYLKIEYCSKLGLQYFYPGYFVPGYAVFDYKLDIASSVLEFYSLHHGGQWRSIKEFSVSSAPLEEMQAKLVLLSEKLLSYQLSAQFFHYEFYNANLTPEFQGLDLFDFPVFLYCFELPGELISPVVVYDPRDQQYHLIHCESLFKTEYPIVPQTNYAANLLTMRKYLFSTPSEEVMAEQLVALWEGIKSKF
ncbi:MAG TPA: GNAT family N-acetyltransferase [Cytophagaceae bacterium]|nr:GNAT family N-acetyltransferase [Cytophagaceae bacterium]